MKWCMVGEHEDYAYVLINGQVDHDHALKAAWDTLDLSHYNGDQMVFGHTYSLKAQTGNSKGSGWAFEHMTSKEPKRGYFPSTLVGERKDIGWMCIGVEPLHLFKTRTEAETIEQ